MIRASRPPSGAEWKNLDMRGHAYPSAGGFSGATRLIGNREISIPSSCIAHSFIHPFVHFIPLVASDQLSVHVLSCPVCLSVCLSVSTGFSPMQQLARLWVALIRYDTIRIRQTRHFEKSQRLCMHGDSASMEGWVSGRWPGGAQIRREDRDGLR